VSFIRKISVHSYLRGASSVAGVIGILRSAAHPKILCCIFMSINLTFLNFFFKVSIFNISVMLKVRTIKQW